MTHYVVPLFTATLLLGQASPPAQAPPPDVVMPMIIAARQAQQPTQAPKTYNEQADAKQAIADKVKRAAIDGIRVLINWGANDDPLCAKFLLAQKPPAVSSKFFADEYVPVYVNVGNLDKNLDLAKSYGVTLTAGNLPALTILDTTGKVVANASARDFLGGTRDAFSSPLISTFYTKHQAPPPNDTAKFEAAVSKAKKDGKTVFVWFSAPW
jgi:hypothetical protein